MPTQGAGLARCKTTAAAGEILLLAARSTGVNASHRCYIDGLRAHGNYRACEVELRGENVTALPRCGEHKLGMKVPSTSTHSTPTARLRSASPARCRCVRAEKFTSDAMRSPR